MNIHDSPQKATVAEDGNKRMTPSSVPVVLFAFNRADNLRRGLVIRHIDIYTIR